MRKYLALLSVAACMLAAPGVSAESVPNPDSENSVPELAAFHEVIAPMWHEAYPAKDVEVLKGFVPRINELATELYKAQLPGILREKKAAWKTGVAALRKSVKAYNAAAKGADAAAKGADAAALLAAAEDLHKKYEMLVRTIRPVLPEMEAFHKRLYVLYHKDLPAGSWKNIGKAAPELAAEAADIAKARLPKRYEGKAAEFTGTADSLAKAAAELQSLGASAGGPAVKKALLNVHARYLALQNLFE